MQQEMLQKAVELLARREHSRKELTAKLVARQYDEKCSPAQIEQLMERLEEKGLLSNARFTEAYVASRKLRGFGPVRIRHELRQRGIEDSLVEQYLDVDGHEWQEILYGIWENKYGTDVPKDYALKSKQIRFLQGRGFSHQQINDIYKKNNDE